MESHDEVVWTSSELAQLERLVFHENMIDSEKMAMAEQFVKISSLFQLNIFVILRKSYSN